MDKTVEVEGAVTGPGTSGGPWFLKAEPGKVLGTHIGAAGGLSNFQPLAVSFESLETQLQLLTKANETRVHPVECHIEGAPATITVEQASTQKFATESGTVSCAKLTATLPQSMGTVTELTMSNVSYGECTAQTIFGNIAVTVDMATNNCDYRLHAKGEIDLICEPGSSGVIVSGPGCSVTVPSQTGLSGIAYTNAGTGAGRTVAMTMNVANLTSTGSGFLCNKVGTFSNGNYTGTAVAKAESGGMPVGFWWE